MSSTTSVFASNGAVVMRKLAMRAKAAPLEANTLVVEDIGNPPPLVRACAILTGAVVVEPAWIRSEGTAPAIRVEKTCRFRFVHITNAFARAHVGITSLLIDAAERRRLTLLSRQAFLKRYTVSAQRTQSTRFLALNTEKEQTAEQLAGIKPLTMKDWLAVYWRTTAVSHGVCKT